MELAARLRKQALETNERRVIVLAGTPERTRESVSETLEAADIDLAATTYVGPENPVDCESIDYARADELLGTTREALILDCHDRCEPNLLGGLIGTIDGGGLGLLLTPPLEDWPTMRDEFDASLAVPPYDTTAVRGNFRRHLVDTIRSHRGIAIVDAHTGTVEREGLETAPLTLTGECMLTQRAGGSLPAEHRFPEAVYRNCKTVDQRETLKSFERLLDPGEAIVLQADRGRGKSSVAGLGAAGLALAGLDILVTAPAYRNTKELFARAGEVLATLDSSTGSAGEDPQVLETDHGRIRFVPPATAATLPESPDRVIVDEAAAFPVRLLDGFLEAPGVAFSTTVHGYEGSGRGFAVRFREHLESSAFTVTDCTLVEPIRYAGGDPIEVWSFRALALDARPPVDQLVDGATLESVRYEKLSAESLCEDEQLLRNVFGLLVLAHYRTEPNDLARLLDAPNVTVHTLLYDNYPVAVALVAEEGGLSAETCARIYEGERINGNLIPDLLASQLRDEAAPALEGKRIMRIATHARVRSRGLGSHLVLKIRDQSTEDWLGVGYGGTPELVEFWAENGFRPVHVGISRSDRSGEHAVIMLDPLSSAGDALLDRHTDWFLRRFPGTLRESLSELDPDIVRSVCRATNGELQTELTQFEWRLAAGIPSGASIFAMAPSVVSTLTLRYILDEEVELLEPRAERLLIRKALQHQSWEAITTDLEYESPRMCKRALGDAVKSLVETYGDDAIRAELKRFGEK